MTSVPHEPSSPETHRHNAVEMPEPTVAPLVMSLGMALLASGIIIGPAFLIVGGVVLLYGLGMWVSNLLPGRGHIHEEFVPPERRPKPVKPVLGAVRELRPGMPGYRVRLPEKVHPISAGIKGGIVGGLIMPIPAFLWGLLSGNGIWYPVNLLAGMILPGVDDTKLHEFNLTLLVSGLAIHAISAVVIGMIYGVLLPTLPAIPQAMAWGALLAPILWTTATFLLMGAVNPGLREGISWPYFIASQFVYGVAMTLVVVEATGLPPIRRGLLGGFIGGMLMPLPAILWSLGTGKGYFYPINLLAGMVLPGINDPADPTLRQFHPDWFAVAVLMHFAFSLAFGVACALLLPRLQPIPGPFAWGAMLLPLLWTAASYGLMGVVNPVLQEKVDWFWFIVSQFAFGIAAAVVVIRSEQIVVPPAGRGVPS